MALIKITILDIILKFILFNFKKRYPPEAVKNKAGKVAMPNNNIAKLANKGFEIDALSAKAP